MNNCDNAPWASEPTDKRLEDIIVTDKEFEDFCAQKYGFPKPEQLPSVVGVFDPASMPRMWPVTALRVVLNPDTVQPVADFSMALSDITMVTDTPLPDPKFTKNNLNDWIIWERFNDSQTSESGKVYCPITGMLFNADTKIRAFKGILIRYRSATGILDVMRNIFPQAAKKLDDDIKVITNPRFRLPVEKSKKDVNKSKTTTNTDDEEQEKAKQSLISKIVFSAYYNSLFKEDCTTLCDSHDLTIIRLQCPLREEDETEEARGSSWPQKRTRYE